MKRRIKSNTVAVAKQTNKLRVLLVPDHSLWILGTWAKQIVRVGKLHDYYVFPQLMLPHYPSEWKALLDTVDVVHFLNQWEIKSINVPENLPCITSIHHVVDAKEWEEQLLPLTKADAVMVVAEEWREFLLGKGVSAETLHLFYNGVDTTRFYPFNNKLYARKRLGIYSNSKLIGYSAKFTSNNGGRKGVDIFQEAIKLSASMGCKFGVLITGPGWDDIVREIESYGIEVHYRPFLPERLMPNLYNALDLYVVTSRIEGGPVPLLESMACGVPVITTPVGIAKEYINHNVNGLIIPIDNAQATAKAISHLLRDPELSKQLGDAALQTIREHLSWDNTLAGIEQMYTKVWQEKIGKGKVVNSTNTINPISQINWAINTDCYIWYQQLYENGYCREGLRGMLKSSWQVGGQNRQKLLHQTFSTIRNGGFRKALKVLV